MNQNLENSKKTAQNNPQNSSSPMGTGASANSGTPDLHLQQRLWVKEQEISALKVQNRHLITKLEEAEKKGQPNQINTQHVAQDVQRYLRPVIGEIEKSLEAAFEMIQGSMRGIYSQSQRVQNAMEELATHTQDFEVRIQEQRKADQVYFQEKIFSSITTFCDRIERQIENRLRALSAIEVMSSKQEELLSDLDQIKANTGNLSRDTLQQAQNQKSEFKALRNEVSSMMNYMQIINSVRDHDIKTQPPVVDSSAVTEALAPMNQDDIESIESAIEAGSLDASQDEMALVLELLKSQKTELKQASEKAMNYLKANAGSVQPPEFKPDLSQEPEANS